MGAAFWGRTETVLALLVKGADANAKNNKGRTALMLAQKEAYKEIVHVLKEAGAKE